LSFQEFTECIENVLVSDAIHKDDRTLFRETFSLEHINEKLFTKSLENMECRIFADDIYKWFEVRIFNNSSDAILFISDIDDHKINLLRKLRDMRRDLVTGTYIADDFDDIVSEFIERDGKKGEHMMLNISLYDSDILKEKNQEFVMCLKKCIRKDDVIEARSDGSYFVFLKSISRSFAGRFIDKTLQIFESIHPEDKSLREFCVGISLIVDADKTVKELKQQSSDALKKAMEKGAGEYCID
jgi:GGDEF domain-containing protein